MSLTGGLVADGRLAFRYNEMAVPVPTYDKFIEPILRYLAAHPEGAPARDAYEAAAAALKLSESERDELLPSGAQAVYKNRAGWAHDRLKRAGHSLSLRRGYWQLSKSGTALAKQYNEGVPEAVVEDIASGHDGVRLRDAVDGVSPMPIDDRVTVAPSVASPDDRLEAAVAELRPFVTTTCTWNNPRMHSRRDPRPLVPQ